VSLPTATGGHGHRADKNPVDDTVRPVGVPMTVLVVHLIEE
jgi:hypothetical protein